MLAGKTGLGQQTLEAVQLLNAPRLPLRALRAWPSNCRMGSFAPFGGFSFDSTINEGGQCFQHVLRELLM